MLSSDGISKPSTCYCINFNKLLVYLTRGSSQQRGILKDTTIVWNYPEDLNQITIGVDLLTVESQRFFVNNVKENGQVTFHGPVDFLQGGSGFIIRDAIYLEEGQYWGQIAIVFKGERFIEKIREIETFLNVKAIIMSGDELVYGDQALLEKKVHWFRLTDEMFDWDFGIVNNQSDGFHYLYVYMFVVIGVLIFASITSASYIMLKSNDIIKYESMHDQLTGVRNRNSLDESMEQLLAAANRNNHKFAILILDLNKFKDINDTFGHTVGDLVLKETAHRLRSAARKDEILFRVGGDEFLLAVPYIESEEVVNSIKKRFKSISTYKLETKGYSVTVSSSIGYAVLGDDGDTFDQLFLIADKRMYEEKSKVI